jgi:uncharacterized ubiquitin-like protein YukD
MSSTPPPAAGRSAAGWRLPEAPVNLMRNFTLETVQRAIENGRDINEQDHYQGSTLLMEAVARGKEDVVEFLLDNGADVNIQDHDGVTALGYYKDAIYKEGNLEKIVQMLLEVGALFLPDNNGKMINVMSEDLYDELSSQMAYNASNSPYSFSSNENQYGNSTPTLGRIRREMTEENRAIQRAEQQALKNRFAARNKAENNANTAWRASVGLPPSEREVAREYPPVKRRAKNIRDLIRLYISQFVREIKLGSMSAASDKTIFVDVRMSVYELKKIIQYFFQYDVKFDLVYPAFHIAGKKTLDDDRVLSNYGVRNGSRLIISLRIQSGYSGGTRRSKRKGRKTRRN